MTDNTSNTSSIRSILEQEKLSGENFLDWYKNLRTVLEHEGKFYVFETILPQPPTVDSTMAEKAAYKKHENDVLDVSWLIFASMTPEIQLLHEDKNAFDMIETMKHRYQREIRQERFELSKTLFRCKFSPQKETVEVHVQEMIGYLERLENLGYPLGQELATDLILQSLPASLCQYIMDTKLNEIDKSLPNLLQIIKDSEKEIGKISPDISSITQGLKPTGSVAEEGNCFHCGEKFHWTGGNCNVYSEELQDNNEGVICISGTRELQCAAKECELHKRKAEVEAEFTPAPKCFHKLENNIAGKSPTKGPLPKKGQSSKAIHVAGSNQTKPNFRFKLCDSCGRHHPGECWVHSGACLGCGQIGHFRRNCPTNPGEPFSKARTQGK
ncbi:unnamed protein product [Cuscuta campestris]|uniref:CCHC-type domain-containing protein n=1 Tax=Cuscuta campestris TaxID=132261 RepID=A0A484LI77_9ASTE|nr:unnamed protein product [Cuscuta campestris]